MSKLMDIKSNYCILCRSYDQLISIKDDFSRILSGCEPGKPMRNKIRTRLDENSFELNDGSIWTFSLEPIEGLETVDPTTITFLLERYKGHSFNNFYKEFSNQRLVIGEKYVMNLKSSTAKPLSNKELNIIVTDNYAERLTRIFKLFRDILNISGELSTSSQRALFITSKDGLRIEFKIDKPKNLRGKRPDRIMSSTLFLTITKMKVESDEEKYAGTGIPEALKILLEDHNSTVYTEMRGNKNKVTFYDEFIDVATNMEEN